MTAATVHNDPLFLTKASPAHGTALIAVMAAAAGLLHPTAWSMVKTWASSSSFHHGFLVLPLAIWMIAAHSPRPRVTGAAGAAAPGFALFCAAGLLWLAGRAAGVLLVEQAAFVSLLIGAVGVVYGASALRAWSYPLAFLFFMVPFGAVVVPLLQTLTAHMAAALLAAAHMPASIEGALITTRAGAFEIAEACAGLRFLIAAVMLAAIFAYVSFATWRKRAAFLTAAVAFALIANGLRVFALIFVATATDKRWAVGPDHLLVGWGFYAALFAILIAVGRRYADPMAPARLRGPMNHAHIAGAIPAIAIIGALSLYADIVIDRRAAPNAPATVSLISAPGWRILAPPQNWRAEIKSADYNASATYVSGGAAVYVSFGAFTHDRRGAEIVTEDNRAFDGNYWRKIAARRDAIYLFGLSRQTEFALLAGPQGRRLAAVNAYWLDGEIYNDPRRVKLAQMKARLLGRNPPGGMIVFASAYAQDPAEAIAAIRRFTTDLEPLDAWLARMSAH